MSIWTFLADWSTILDALATATTLNFIGFNAATLEPQLRQFGLTPVLTGCIFILTGAVYAATSPIMGKICQSGVSEDASSIYHFDQIKNFTSSTPKHSASLDVSSAWLVSASWVHFL